MTRRLNRQIMVRLTEDELVWLEEHSIAAERTMSQTLRLALRRYREAAEAARR